MKIYHPHKNGFKICNRCLIEKPETDFYRRGERSRREHIRSTCIECNKLEARAKRRNNQKEFREYSRSYYAKNRERITEWNREYWRKTHDKQMQRKTLYKKQKWQTDPLYRLQACIRATFFSYFNRRGIIKTETFFSYTGITFNKYLLHLKQDPNWKLFKSSKNVHIDHIIPCSLYDFSNEMEIKKCWNPRNLRIITAQENIRKANSLDIQLVSRYHIEDLLPKGITA